MDLSKFPVVALFVVTVICSVLAETFKVTCAKTRMKKESEVYLFNAVLSAFCALVLALTAGFALQGSWFTILLAVGFGVCAMVANVTSTKAVQVGPWSYTRVIICSSTVFTALSGWAFWHESLGVWKIVGIVLMFFCCCFAVDKGESEQKSASAKWFLLCVLAMLCTTFVGVMQKSHQSSAHKGELTVFLVTAFAVSAISSFVIFFLYKNKEERCAVQEGATIKTPWIWIIGISAVSGLFVAGNNLINLYLSGAVDSAIMFPIVNGIPLILNVLTSFLLFKEKMTKKQWIGFALGILSVGCLCL
jgi:drug/metabolite transporter (DMT)-like permease